MYKNQSCKEKSILILRIVIKVKWRVLLLVKWMSCRHCQKRQVVLITLWSNIWAHVGQLPLKIKTNQQQIYKKYFWNPSSNFKQCKRVLGLVVFTLDHVLHIDLSTFNLVGFCPGSVRIFWILIASGVWNIHSNVGSLQQKAAKSRRYCWYCHWASVWTAKSLQAQLEVWQVDFIHQNPSVIFSFPQWRTTLYFVHEERTFKTFHNL